MNKILVVLLCLVFSLCSYGQTRKINGLIFEHLNKKPIMGVKISPVLNEDDCFSNPLGEFTAIVYYKYFDSLVFTHPEYHTYVHEINRGNKNTLNIIMISNDYPIDTLINPDLDENISIYGVVLDSPARKILKNACIRLKSNQIISRSLYNGRFTATLPRSADSILVTHPECLSKTVSLKAFKRKGPSSPTSRRIMLTRVIEPIVPPPEIFVDTVISSDKEESKEIYGFIIDSISRKSILNVNIRLENNQIIFNTEQRGHFNVLIPLSSQNILITHPDYRSKTVSVDLLKRRGGGRYSIELMKTKLSPLDSLYLQKNLKIEQTDSIWKSKKNALSLSLLELYRGGIGVRYERFIKIKQSIGLHFTYYLFGWGYDTYSSDFFGVDKLPASHFTGFKMAPFYRYYFFRNNRKGLYFEVKMLTGYFNFSELFYVDYNDGEYFSENFWSFGGGVSVGHSLEFKNSMAVINLSVGLQYFPMNVPETMNYGNLEVSNDWWKILGPGAIFELKLTIGGIF